MKERKSLASHFFLGGVFAAQPESWQSGRCVINGVATIQGFECLFQNILRILTTVAGLAFGLMIIVGGFKLIFAAGEQKGLQSAKNTFTFAFIGIALVIAVWFILKLIEHFTGMPVTEFEIPGTLGP